MHILQYSLIFSILFIVEMVYIKLAGKYRFVNHRKAENRDLHGYDSTIRGGGIIFLIAAISTVFLFSFNSYYFLTGLLLLAIISFLDDILNVTFKVRLIFHVVVSLLLLYQLDLFYLPITWLIILVAFIIATINAYNFMDGINGITGGYSLLTLVSLYYINHNIVHFTSPDFLIVVGLSLIVFNFFNFRTKAKCFAGDVGSVGIAFIIVFLIGQLILKTHNVSYILLLLVYGTDTAITVLFRKVRGENIFEAHRSHFYQYLSNQRKCSHLFVSSLYILAQLLINVLLISLTNETMIYTVLLFFAFIVIYLSLRFKFEGKERLLLSYDNNA